METDIVYKYNYDFQDWRTDSQVMKWTPGFAVMVNINFQAANALWKWLKKGGRKVEKKSASGDCHKSPSFYHQDSQRVRVHAHQLCVFLRRNLLPQKLLWLTGLRVMSFGDSLAWPGFSCVSLAEFTVGPFSGSGLETPQGLLSLKFLWDCQ